MKIQPLKTRPHWNMLLYVAWFACLNVAQAGAPIGEVQVSPNVYPKVYYRGPEYAGMHCIAFPPPNLQNELYMLKVATLKELPNGRKREIEVAEFFSGHRYKAQVVNDGAFQVSLTTKEITIVLKCEVENIVKFGKSSPVNAQGDYLSSENVDVETGKWGNVHINNKCDVGGVWEACDMGLQGISRRRIDGTVVWSRLFAVATPYPSGHGHPVWNLPDALNVLDGNWRGTWLSDGTALFTISNRGWNGPTIRVNMNNGTLFDSPSEVAVVPLEDWAALKHVMRNRWAGDADPCNSLHGENEAICRRKVTEMYFYTQQSYLFPNLSFTAKK